MHAPPPPPSPPPTKAIKLLSGGCGGVGDGVELMMAGGRQSTLRAVLIKARIERDSNRLKVYIYSCVVQELRKIERYWCVGKQFSPAFSVVMIIWRKWAWRWRCSGRRGPRRGKPEEMFLKDSRTLIGLMHIFVKSRRHRLRIVNPYYIDLWNITTALFPRYKYSKRPRARRVIMFFFLY